MPHKLIYSAKQIDVQASNGPQVFRQAHAPDDPLEKFFF